MTTVRATAAPESTDAVMLRGVTKTFGETTAVAGLDLTIPRGGLYGFIGPNGTGKTTTIRLIMSILFPDAGEVSVLGHASALDANDRIGYLPGVRAARAAVLVESGGSAKNAGVLVKDRPKAEPQNARPLQRRSPPREGSGPHRAWANRSDGQRWTIERKHAWRRSSRATNPIGSC